MKKIRVERKIAKLFDWLNNDIFGQRVTIYNKQYSMIQIGHKMKGISWCLTDGGNRK